MAERFGKYQLERKLAVGGMAEIFLATHQGPEGFKKNVAIKRILPHLTEDQDFTTMFLDEARLVARFNHPNIVQIFELGQVQKRYFLAMEYIHGQSMSKVLKACAKKKVPFPIEYGAKILSYACEGLDYAHNFTDADGTPLNLIHRDVSPQNIMLTYDGVVKVLDFGIAKAAGNLYQTRTSSLKGKAAYMSPEQITQKSGLDRRSDIFSLGIVLHEFATGKRPFDGDTELELMMSIVQKQANDPRTIDPNIPEELISIMLRALAKDRTKRYQNAREMRADLEHFLMSRRVMVDSYTLGSFLREVMPAGESLVGYSVPTPSRPSLQIEEEEKERSRPRQPGTGRRPAVPDDEAPTVLTPSEPMQPAVEENRGGSAAPIGDAPTAPPGPRPEPSSKPAFFMGMLVVLVVALGGVAAWLAFGRVGNGRRGGNPVTTGQDAGIANNGPADRGAPDAGGGLAAAADAGTGAGKDGSNVAARADPGPPEKVTHRPPRRRKKRRRRRRRRVAEPRPRHEPKQPDKKETEVASTGPGSLTIYSRPWTEVTIDGTSYGATPLDGPIELKPGVHVLQLANAAEGIRHRQRVKVQPGKDITIRKDFRKGFLQVFVKPFGDVYVNGKRKGLTPLDKPIQLYEGVHTLRVYCARTGKEETQKVHVDPGKTNTVKLDLR